LARRREGRAIAELQAKLEQRVIEAERLAKQAAEARREADEARARAHGLSLAVASANKQAREVRGEALRQRRTAAAALKQQAKAKRQLELAEAAMATAKSMQTEARAALARAEEDRARALAMRRDAEARNTEAAQQLRRLERKRTAQMRVGDASPQGKVKGAERVVAVRKAVATASRAEAKDAVSAAPQGELAHLEHRAAGRKVVFRALHGKEQVWIPLRGAAYRVDSAWDRSVIVLSGELADEMSLGTQPVQGQVVSTIDTSALRSSTVRVMIELNRPASPDVEIVRRGSARYLRVSYLL
jgi:hypothetical protein